MVVSSRRQNRLGVILFLLPVLILFSLYFVYPLGFVFFTSLFESNGISEPTFVGLGNFADLFSNRTFQISLKIMLCGCCPWALCRSRLPP